jgi:hypothetical protein
MIALRLIEDAKAIGLSIEVDGEDLVIEADTAPPEELIGKLRAHKAEVVALLCRLPEPMLLRNGRRLYRFRAVPASPSTPEQVANLIDQARYHGVTLVADGCELIVVERSLSALPEETLRALKSNAGSIIASLLGESRQRCARKSQ